MEGNEPVVIPNSEGHRTTPSVVAFTEGGERKVGDPAKRQAITNPMRTIFSIKRFMGETYDQVRSEIERAPYKVVKGPNDTPRVEIDGRQYSPQEISAIILQKMKKTAEDYLGQTVDEAVITVPAYFSDSQRQATKEAAEKPKIELSSSTSTEINLPYIMPVNGIPQHLVMTLTRAKFEQLCDHLIHKTIEPCKQALRDAGLEAGQIDEVILVGGSTRIPAIQQIVKEFFGKEPNKSVNPDEVVAIGAAIQGGVLTGEVKDVLLLDVTPLSLGIETLGGVMTKLIEANTTIPTRKSEVFSTAADNQPSVEINVCQGERPLARDNKSIGRFHLDGIPAAPRGVPQIEVTFDIDANGILNVSAKDKGTGKEQKIRIEASSGLTEEEIQRMRDEAKANEAKDKEEKERIDKINAADSNIFATEKQLKEYGDKLPADKKSAIEAALGKLKEAHKNADVMAIDTAITELNAAWQAASQDIYAQQQAQGGANANANAGAGASGAGAGAGAGSAAGDSSQPEDVEFEEVK